MIHSISNFATLAPTSRLWVYASARPFTATEITPISELLATFVNSWKAHGNDLDANYAIHRNQFILIAVDEAQSNASGCAIDKSVHLMQQLEQQFNLQLMDRSLVFYIDANNQVAHFKFNTAETLLANTTINATTIIFDTAITRLDANLEVELKNTWLNKYLGAEVV